MFQSIITYIANHYAYSYVIISRFFQNLGAQTTCIMSIMEANEALRFYIVMLRAILLAAFEAVAPLGSSVLEQMFV